MSNLYNMSLHEILTLEDGIKIIRVPGGWIYRFESYNGESESSCFVPYSKKLERFQTFNNNADNEDVIIF